MAYRSEDPQDRGHEADKATEEARDRGHGVDKVAEGSAKQFARGVGDEHVDERMADDPRPSETVKGERVPAGSGKQFARGVGDPEEPEERPDRSEP